MKSPRFIIFTTLFLLLISTSAMADSWYQTLEETSLSESSAIKVTSAFKPMGLQNSLPGTLFNRAAVKEMAVPQEKPAATTSPALQIRVSDDGSYEYIS